VKPMHITRRQLALLGLSSMAGLAGQARGQSTRQSLSFPRDFGAHPESGVEWWYLTGLLHLEEAGTASEPRSEPSYGYQITFFRLRGPAAPEARSAFAPRQLILAHLALSDLKAGRHYAEQRLAREGFGQVAASEVDCALRLRDWSLQRVSLPGQAATLASRYQARATGRDFALDLQLQSTQPLLLQGEQGYSRKSPPAQGENFSYYYSQPQLATRGQLSLKGRRFAVAGRSWLDHEWSNGLLGREAVGWDWLGINLLDGGALTLFRLRSADGRATWAGGSWRQADGSTRSLAAEQIRFTPGRRWRSPASQAEYPVQWSLDTPAGRFQLRALMDAQELGTQGANGLLYWEGAAELLDEQGQRRLGLGYLEMTGYAARLALP
jgi:predicted secreted hydrolase